MWEEAVSQHEDLVRKLNSKIDKYNLMVPLIQKQKLHVSLKKEAERVLKTGETCQQRRIQKHLNKKASAMDNENSDVFSFFGSLFNVQK